LKIYVDIFL